MLSNRDTLPEGIAPELGAPGDSADRITVSTLPTSEALSGERPLVAGEGWRSAGGELSVRAIERLLVLWTELPVAAGDRAVTRAVVDAVASLLPRAHVGACLVPVNGGAPEIVSNGDVRAQLDPTRLFPYASHERVVPIEPGGSTIHVASDEPSDEAQSASLGALLQRAATVARRGIELARMQARATQALAEARSLNSHIAQAEKLASLGQIAAGVVHELNNPLTSIVAYTDYLIRKAGVRPSGPDADEIDRLRRISESAGRMLRFTRDLVSYARPASETPVQVSIQLVIDQAVAFCEHVLTGANASVVRVFGSSLPPVLGKPEQLAQIFVNLITNACHAMPPGGGTLTITTREDRGAVVVELTDTGHGIAPEHVAHVFTPFFTTKTSGAGTGLGLAIVKSILDSHGGSIRASSAPGKGATFSITLPVLAR